MIRRVVVAITLAAALAACGSSTDEPEPKNSVTFERPTTPPFPTAKDGQNYKACNDGNCEVLIRKHAVLTLNGQKNTATVKDGGVRLTSSSGYVSLSGLNGAVSWSNGSGPLHSATLKAAEGDQVIMVIATRR